MKTLTNKEKIEAYYYVINQLNDDNRFKSGICYYLNQYLFSKYYIKGSYYEHLFEIFPEFIKFIDFEFNKDHHWWPETLEGNKKRVMYLELLINKLQSNEQK